MFLNIIIKAVPSGDKYVNNHDTILIIITIVPSGDKYENKYKTILTASSC